MTAPELPETVPPISSDRTSTLLARVLDELPREEVTVGFVVLQLRRRSFGGLFILLAALALFPGLSFFAGLAMLVPGAQMAIGFRAPLLPRFLRRRVIARTRLRALGARLVPWLERIERRVRPRWFALTLPPFPNLVGVLVFLLGVVVMLPLPFSNLPPAVALVCLSLGLLERDGVMMAVGLVAAAGALAVGAAMGFAAGVLAMQIGA